MVNRTLLVQVSSNASASHQCDPHFTTYVVAADFETDQGGAMDVVPDHDMPASPAAVIETRDADDIMLLAKSLKNK